MMELHLAQYFSKDKPYRNNCEIESAISVIFQLSLMQFEQDDESPRFYKSDEKDHTFKINEPINGYLFGLSRFEAGFIIHIAVNHRFKQG